MTEENTGSDGKCNIFQKSLMNDIKFYEETYKLYAILVTNHKDCEPLKIFKNRHKKWQEKMDFLQDKYDSIYDKFLNKIDDLYEFNGLPTKKNKKIKNE